MTLPQLATAVCPLCASRLQPGLGHACSNVEPEDEQRQQPGFGPEDKQPDGWEYHRRKLAWALLGLVGRCTRDPRSSRPVAICQRS